MMRRVLLVTSMLLSAGLAQAQVVSPLGGSTNNAGTRPPATQTAPVPSTRSMVVPAAPAATAPAAPAPSSTSTTATTPHHRRSLAERFDASNTTHDGKLTVDQARAGHMRSVVRDFDKIDTTKRGYVTLDEIKAYQAKARAARRAARAATPE